VDGYDDFIERLESALESEDGREDFVHYLQGLTREERATLLAEAERHDPEGAALWDRKESDVPRRGSSRKSKTAKKGGKA
jgi:hypothetical protein